MCGGNIPERKQSNADCAKYYVCMVTIEIAINSTRGAQHFALGLQSCRYCIAFEVMFWFLILELNKT